ncbi:MAG: hypothetical protein FWG66_00460, partial [Spirochaetes bacterium]|nr:hypothetical protein [Spirochaetota bacterium]
MTKRSICGYCKRSFTDTPYIEQGAPFCSADCALAFRAKTGGGGGGSGLKHAFEHDKLTLKRNLDTAGVGFLVDVAPYVAKGVLAVGGLAVTGLVAGGKLAAKKAQEHAEKKEQERLLAEQIARERLAAARAAAKSAVAAAKNTGADNAAANFLHPKTSSINPWSYAVPVFFKDLNLPLNEEEGTALIDNQELPFTYEVRMCTFGAEVKSAGDLPLPQEWTVSNKKNTKIDGFPAVCYECHTEDVYFQAAYLTYNQKAGIHFGLNIGVPKDDKQEYKELMDAFINSFKVDEKKIQAKYGKEIVGKVEAVDYTEALLKKCPKLKNANQDGSNFSFPVKFTTDETAKFQDVLKAFEEIPQAAKDDSFPIVIVSSTGIFGSQKKGMLLTKKAIYCHQNYGEGPNYLPWQSINKIAPSKKQKGKKLVDCLLIELQSGRNFTTEQIAPKDSVFDILNIMWQDFGGEKAAAKNAELAEQNASRKAEIAAMKGKAAKYIEGLLEKCGTPANDSGFFPAKQNAESFNDMFFNEKLSKDEYPVFCSANIMLTNKAVYAAPFFDKNASRDPWPSITKIAEKKALFGNKVFVELQEAGNIVTRELASGDNKQHDYTVKVLNQMLIDFSGSPPQSTPEPQPATTLGTAQTCGGCGATLKEGAEFCTACGAACGAACGVKCGTKAEVQPEPAPAPQPAAVQQEPAPATKPAAVQPEPAPAVQPAAVRPEPAHATQPAAVQPEQAPAVQP